MCLVCADFNKGKLNIKEARRNLSEIVIGSEFHLDEQEHVMDVLNMLSKAEEKEKHTD